MPEGKMPVYETDGRFMGNVLWKGNMSSGSWGFVPSKQLDELAKRRVKKQITELAEARKDLEAIRYRGPSGKDYRGWHGFTGLLGALRSALPALKMDVDRSNVTWPPQNLPEQPLGIDTDEEERQDKEEQGHQETLMDLELQEFRGEDEQ